MLFFLFQDSTGTQTLLSCLMHVTPNFKLFNKYITTEKLSTVTSFITENTLAFDDSPVYVDHLVQTVESGGFLTDKNQQTENCESLNFQVYTENCLSSTFRNSDSSNSFSQTIIQYVCNSE